MIAETWVAMLGACVILIHCVCVADRMDVRTSNRVRAAYGLVGVAALAVALSPFYGAQPSWADAGAIAAIALFMLVDRRGRHVS